jgi:hypothetical protein
MKNQIVFIFLFVSVLTFQGSGQIEFGMKAGISSFQLGQKSIVDWTQQNKFLTQLTEAEYGHHFGLYTRVLLTNFYIEPAVMFQSSTFTYMLEEYSEAGVVQLVKNDRYNQIQVPLMLGIKTGFFRVQAGPVANVLISKTSDLWDFDGYKDKLKTFQYGIQAGAGVDVWRFRFDVLYENNLGFAGENIQIGGRDFILNPNPSRLLFTLGYKF